MGDLEFDLQGVGRVSLVFNPEGVWADYSGGKKVDLPAHACLFRRDMIEDLPKSQTGKKHGQYLWFEKSLIQVNPELTFFSNFQTLTIVKMLEEKTGVVFRGHFYGYETYFHGTEEQLKAFANELRTNNTEYQWDAMAQ